jgi:hypothetical protein
VPGQPPVGLVFSGGMLLLILAGTIYRQGQLSVIRERARPVYRDFP